MTKFFSEGPCVLQSDGWANFLCTIKSLCIIAMQFVLYQTMLNITTYQQDSSHLRVEA